MKFLIDAQLPLQLKKYLELQKLDVKHTDDLPEKQFTTDNYLRKIANEENRILITKDEDFVETCLLKNSPQKLLWITTGNIVNKKLIELFERNFQIILEGFNQYRFIEMNSFNIFYHE